MSDKTSELKSPLIPPKNAILIGASGGIGAALARQLASEGWALALLGREKKALTSLADELNAEYGADRARTYPHDVRKYQAIPAQFQRLLADLGSIEAIIYLAGYQPVVALDQYDNAEDQQMIEVNLLGAVGWLNQAAVLFERMGAGQIVGISSVAGDRGRVGNPVYNTTKAGLSTYLEALRNRLSRHGVNVLTIKPGFVETALLRKHRPEGGGILPEQAALHISRAMRARKQVVYVLGIWRWIMLVIRHIPSFVFRRLKI